MNNGADHGEGQGMTLREERQESIKTVIMPVAGWGTRMRAVDSTLPKEMLMLGGKPIMRYALEEALAAGLERVVLVIRAGKEMLLEAAEGLDLTVETVYQEEMLGECDALQRTEGLVGDQPVVIYYPDMVHLADATFTTGTATGATTPAENRAGAPGALATLCRAYALQPGTILGLTAVDAANAERFSNAGRVDLQRPAADAVPRKSSLRSPLWPPLWRIVRQIDKGPGHFVPRYRRELRSCGPWVTQAGLYDLLREARLNVKTGEEFTDGELMPLIMQRSGLWGVELPGSVYDVGNPDGYRACLARLAEQGQG